MINDIYRFYVLSPDRKEIHIKQFTNDENANEFDKYLRNRNLAYILYSNEPVYDSVGRILRHPDGTPVTTWDQVDGNEVPDVKTLIQNGAVRIIAENLNSVGEK